MKINLKRSLYIMIILCSIIPIMIWTLFTMRENSKRTEQIIKDNITAIGGSHAMSIYNFCEARKESMETIARMELVINSILLYQAHGHNTELDSFLEDNEKLKTYIGSISIIDKNYTVIGSSHQHRVGGKSDLQYTPDKFKTGEFIMGNAYDRETDNGKKRMIPAYIGIFHDGELIGYLVEEIDCDYFDRYRLQTDFLEVGTFYLLDESNNIITAGGASSADNRDDIISTPEEREDYIAAWNQIDHDKVSEGIIEYKFGDEEYITYFSDISYSNWSLRITENLSAQIKMSQNFYLILLFEGIAMMAMLIVVQIIFTRKLTAPVGKIAQTMKTIEERHDYSLRTEITGDDEVGIISKGIDELLGYIEREDLEERRIYIRNMEEAKRIAEESSRAKTDFMSQMSHDIRTPMNAIIGFTKLAKKAESKEEIMSNYIPKIETASNQLLMIINDVLEMNSIEKGNVVFHREAKDIQSLVENNLTIMRLQAEKKNIRIQDSIALNNRYVYCDENHFNRVLMNLLSNAIKFTPEGGLVTVSIKELSASDTKASYEISVSDTGIGMAPEFIPLVFDPFERERTSTVSRVEGTGLGMAIVKKIVDATGGSIEVTSEQNRGTTFTYRFDLKLLEADKREKFKTAIHNKDKEEYSLEELTGYFEGKRILLVEDNEFNRTIAEELLQSVGFAIETAEDGHIAVAKVQEAPEENYYDVILMDVQMPTMNGYEATKAIRMLQGARSQVKIIALTANAFASDRIMAIEAGMNEHLAKPIDVNLLYRTLQEIL